MSTIKSNSRVGGRKLPVTFGELKAQFRNQQKEQGTGEGVIRNYECSFNGFVRSLGLNDGSKIGTELNGQFEFKRSEYLAKLKGVGLQEKTIQSQSSHLAAYNRFYVNALPASDCFAMLRDTLSQLLKKSEHSIHTFCRDILGDPSKSKIIEQWCAGERKPKGKDLPLLEQMESGLGAVKATLTSLFPRLRGRRATGLTEYGRKLCKAKKHQYRVWPAHVDPQWCGLVAHMSSEMRQEGKPRNSVWTRSEGSDLPRAQFVKSVFKNFFGFCCLPKEHSEPGMRGLGLREEELTISLINIKEIDEAYLEFTRIRAGGVHTRTTEGFVEIVKSLLRKETGYLYQQADLAQEALHFLSEHRELAEVIHGYLHPDTEFSPDLHRLSATTDWQERCLETRRRLSEILADYYEGDLIEMGRDPEEPIRDILSRPRPLDVIHSMVTSMQMDTPPRTATKRMLALYYRDILLIMLLAANPLRVRQFSIMRFGRHLYQKPDATWWLRFQSKEFKNRRFLRGRSKRNSKSKNYDVRIPANLYKTIELYRTYRPALPGAEECDYVFLSDRPRDVSGEYRMRSESLSGLVMQLTFWYIPGSSSFGPHAFRHIVATHIIKKYGAFGFFLAAKVLNDTLETIEAAYEHLKTSEFYEPYNQEFTEVMTDYPAPLKN